MMEPTTAPQQAPTTPAPQGLPSLAPPAYALPTTPEAAALEKQYLLQDPAFRARAMNPQGREWAHLLALGQAASGTAGPDAAPAGTGPIDPAAEPFKAPATPAEYELHAPEGMKIDAAEVDAWRSGMHAAGVDQDLAGVAWAVSTGNAGRDLTPEQITRAADHAEHTLRGEWQHNFEANLAIANDEGKRIYSALPESLRAGRDWKAFMLDSGLGNSPQFARMLVARAQQRKPAG